MDEWMDGEGRRIGNTAVSSSLYPFLSLNVIKYCINHNSLLSGVPTQLAKVHYFLRINRGI
jgi:hypothetical protein